MNMPYGYVYEIVNTVNGKTYVGSRKLSRDKNWRQYLGSGKLVVQAVNKYGKSTMVKRFLGYAFHPEDLHVLEWKFIQEQKSKGLAQYNIFMGPGAGGDTFSKLNSKTLEEIRKRQSEGAKNSVKAKIAIQIKSDRIAQENQKIVEDNTQSILKLYSEIENATKVSKSLGISYRIVRSVILSNGFTLQNRTIAGYSRPRHESETISAALKKDKREAACTFCDGLFLPIVRELYCSSECKLRSIKRSRASKGFSLTERELRELAYLYIVEDHTIDFLMDRFSKSDGYIRGSLRRMVLPNRTLRAEMTQEDRVKAFETFHKFWLIDSTD